MSLFDKFTTDGNEKEGELAKDGAVLGGGFMAQVRASTVQQEREEVYAALQCAASFHCLVDEWKDCQERLPKTKSKVDLREQERRGKEASNGVVCNSKQVSV